MQDEMRLNIFRGDVVKYFHFLFLQISRFIFLPVYILSNLVPKKKGLQLYGSWFGKEFSDNPKYIYMHAIKHNPNNTYWIAKSDVLFDQLVSSNLKVVDCYSWRSVWLQMRAEIIVFSHSHSTEFLPFCIGKRTKRVQAWHGSPLKKIGYDNTNAKSRLQKRKVLHFLFPYLKERHDLILATGNPDREIFASAFRTDINKISITGYPRNDSLYLRVEGGNKKTNRILYAPTLRGLPGQESKLLNQDNFPLEDIDSYLAEKNCTLHIKLHPVQVLSANDKERISNSRCIRLIGNNFDIYEELNSYDGLIVDYSSIYIDALLTSIKIYMLPIDAEEYVRNEHEFYYDYAHVSPSKPHVAWRDLMDYIFLCDYPLGRHLELREFFHKYSDGKSSERAYREILGLY